MQHKKPAFKSYKEWVKLISVVKKEMIPWVFNPKVGWILNNIDQSCHFIGLQATILDTIKRKCDKN